MQWLSLDVPPPPAQTGCARPAESPADLLRRAQQEAERLLEAARAERQALLLASESEARGIAERARREGLEQGRAEGRAAAEAECTALLRQARRERNQARAQRRSVLDALEADIVMLATDIARRVLDRELEQSPEEVVGLARRLLRRVHGPARARVHPAVAPVLEAEAAVAGALLTVRPDPSVLPGGLILETEDGLLDATLDGRLRRTESILQGGTRHV